MKWNTLVIDIGTSSMRGILYRENGNQITSVQIKYQPVYKEANIVEQSPIEWKDAIARIVKEIVSEANLKFEKIDVISVTAQRSSIFSVNKEGTALCSAIMWQDKRNAEICKELSSYNEFIAERSGTWVNTVYSGSKMLWLITNLPKLYKQTYKLVNVPEYVIHIMTDEFRSDYTYGSRSNLMNIHTRQWDKDLLELFHVKEFDLCELREPGSIIGKISREFALLTGIQEGTPVISAGGDQQCGAIGQGVYKEGEASVVTGTGAFIIAACDKIPEKLEPQVICNCSSVKDKYILETNMLTGGSLFDWFCKEFYQEADLNYDEICQKVRNIYMEEGSCIVLPYFQGRSTPDWNSGATGSFLNVTLSTTREEMLKAVLEGIYLELKNNMIYMEQFIKIHQIYVSGGLSNCKMINQMQSDIYGHPVYYRKDSESTALGALIVALYSMGIYSSVDESFKRVREHEATDIYTVNRTKHEEYQKKQLIMKDYYHKLYEQTKS